MKGRPRIWLVGLAALLCGMAVPPRPPPSLGFAASFAVLGGSAVNAGTSTITGNLGVSPGNTISGSPTVKLGAVFRDDATARQAQKDSAAVYKDLAARTCTTDASTTLAPGVYCRSSLAGTLTLDAGDDPNAVWIFQSTTTLTTAAGTSVRVIKGGFEGNVFWQVGDSATLGAHTAFVGNILARNNITMESGASLSGRTLAQTGVVTLADNNVSLCCKPIVLAPATLPDGKVCVPYAAQISASGGSGSYEFTVSSGALPEGLSPLSPGGVLSGTPSRIGETTFTVTARDKVTGCVGSQVYTIRVTCDVPFTFSPAALPDGTVGVKYTTQISASDGPCVKGPLTFSAASDLAGVDPLMPGGVLSVTPQTAGDFTITVTATDPVSGCAGTHQYPVKIFCPVITISPETLPTATVGQDYPIATIMADGATFSTFPDTPAPGLTLTQITPTTLVLSGKPTQADNFPFTVTATDARGCSATHKYILTVIPAPACPTITILPETLPDATAGVKYTAQLIGSGGEPDYQFGPQNLPCGLTLDPTTGVISGTPSLSTIATAAGGDPTPSMPPSPRCTFTVTAIDKNGCKGTRMYALRVGCPQLSISPSALPNGSVGTFYNQPITAIGGTAPRLFRVVSGSLPPGLTLASNGTLSGTPTTTGPYCFSIAVTDGSGCSGASRAYTIVISAATCPSGTAVIVSPPALPFARTGVPYAQMMTASGGTTPYTFSVLSGTLPPGLTLNPATGLISGTPTSSGTFPLTIAATDANGCLGTTGCSITMMVDIPALSGWAVVVLSMLLGIVAMRRLS
ncbi:MAG TPA: putative Ig domain-containing protein [Thermoanaerobaculia bacterium]|nr:putative Ig domain-containing protein [Thermoanaerobaculia bacterium]